MSNCPVDVQDIVDAIEEGRFDVADSYVRHLAAASVNEQRQLQTQIPQLLERVRGSRRELAAKLRRQGRTRQAKQAYRA